MCNEREAKKECFGSKVCNCKKCVKYRKLYIKYFISCIILLLLCSVCNAITYSKVRIKSNNSYITTTTTIPNSVYWNKQRLNEFFKLRPNAESWGYQSGYFQAIDDVKSLLNLEVSKFKSGPSVRVQETDLKYCLPYNREGYWLLNTTNNRHIQIINSNPNKKSWDWNITSVLIWKK